MMNDGTPFEHKVFNTLSQLLDWIRENALNLASGWYLEIHNHL